MSRNGCNEAQINCIQLTGLYLPRCTVPRRLRAEYGVQDALFDVVGSVRSEGCRRDSVPLRALQPEIAPFQKRSGPCMRLFCVGNGSAGCGGSPEASDVARDMV